MLKQHAYYVYHQEKRVYARMGSLKPVLAETLDTPADAAFRVQQIINPQEKPASYFGKDGYHSPKFQEAISANCEKYVKAAYKKAAGN